MQSDFTNMIEPTPILKSKKCRFLAMILTVALSCGVYIVAIFSFYSFKPLIALFITIFGFIASGIIRSKLRNSSIPQSQQELAYNDKAIATWFVAKELCFGTD